MKQKKCRICKTPFDTAYSTRVVCSVACSLRLVERNKAKRDKLEQANKRKRIREAKEKIKPRSQWMKDAQQAFNAWVRERDYGKPCISCGSLMNDDGLLTGSRTDAGHYRSTGACPELRFHPANCAGQCTRCNQHLSGNSVSYRIGLIERIGLDRVEWLEGQHPPKKYTVEDLKEITRYYRAEARRLKKERESVGNVTGLGMAESRSTVSDRDMEAAERDTVLPADMASRRAG